MDSHWATFFFLYQHSPFIIATVIISELLEFPSLAACETTLYSRYHMYGRRSGNKKAYLNGLWPRNQREHELKEACDFKWPSLLTDLKRGNSSIPTLSCVINTCATRVHTNKVGKSPPVQLHYTRLQRHINNSLHGGRPFPTTHLCGLYCKYQRVHVFHFYDAHMITKKKRESFWHFSNHYTRIHKLQPSKASVSRKEL